MPYKIHQTDQEACAIQLVPPTGAIVHLSGGPDTIDLGYATQEKYESARQAFEEWKKPLPPYDAWLVQEKAATESARVAVAELKSTPYVQDGAAMDEGLGGGHHGGNRPPSHRWG